MSDETHKEAKSTGGSRGAAPPGRAAPPATPVIALRMESILHWVDPIVHVDKPQEKPKADVFVVKPKGAEKPSNGLRTGGFVGLGLGAAGFVLLGVTGGMALQKKSVFDEKCPNNLCTAKADQDGWHEGRTMANVSTVGAVVGVAGVVAGTVMLVMGKGGAEKRAAKPGVHIAVMDAGPTGGLFGVKGVF